MSEPDQNAKAREKAVEDLGCSGFRPTRLRHVLGGWGFSYIEEDGRISRFLGTATFSEYEACVAYDQDGPLEKPAFGVAKGPDGLHIRVFTEDTEVWV